MTTGDYLDTDEYRYKREVHYGKVCEPPAPYYSHQQVVFRIARILAEHVEARGLGEVAIAPVDVILDAEQALIVQPDVLFIAEARRSIIRKQVWGPPDLVVEVISDGSWYFDRGQKRCWYREHGVRECWMVDGSGVQVFVSDFTRTPSTERTYRGIDSITSAVLPDLQATVFGLLLT
jgi:Uma2 family endonuclease